MNAEHFGIAVTFIVMAILLFIIFISQTNIQIFPVETTPQTGFSGYCEKMNLKC
jgi:biotin transporter BioY